MRKILLGAVVAVAMAAGAAFAASPPAADVGYQAKVHQVDQIGFLQRAVQRDEGQAMQHIQVAAQKRDGEATGGGEGKRGSDRSAQVSIAPPYRLLL